MGIVYWDIGLAFGTLMGFTVFLGLWASILMIYDVVGGLALGWLPSAVLAALAFGVGYVLWPLIVFLVIAFILLVLYEASRP